MTVRSTCRNVLLTAWLGLAAGCAGPAEVADDRRDAPAPADTVAPSPVDAPGPTGPEILPRVAERPAPISPYDLEHSDIALRVSFDSARVEGTVRHRLRVLRDGVDALPFHAEGLDVSLALRLDGPSPDTLRLRQDGDRLTLVPARALERGETVHLELRYGATADTPEVGDGLVFVDPSGTDPFLPTQAWTLGQPNANRRWLPTWDEPNDAATLTLALTVPDSMQTVATGDLVESVSRGAWRTDRWRLDVPQPTYLTAFAVGNWRVATDTYVRDDLSRVPLEYWLDPTLVGDAETSFGDTIYMMAVLERMTGMPFVWPEYKQIVLRAFSAGGMEHSTATFLMDEAQLDARERLDGDVNDLLVHELAHHWFGNLVTAESWAHLALNEGFATYAERLFLEAASEPDAAAAKALAQRETYFREARDVRRPVVWYGYEDPLQLFDAHAYEKAALVLHMLREEVGERVFWNAVQRFLAEHVHRPVHLDDLRRAFERASGRDLSAFFAQWFLEPGHPELEITHSLDDALGIYQVRVRQVQDTTAQPVFRFPAELRVSMRGMRPYSERVEVASMDTTFRIAASGTIEYGAFDPEHDVLAQRVVKKPLSEWRAQASEDAAMQARLDAVRTLDTLEAARTDGATVRVLVERAREDASPKVREAAVRGLAPHLAGQPVRDALFRIAAHDASSAVRAAALVVLVESGDPLLRPTLVDALEDPSLRVVRVAADALAARYPDEAARAFVRLEDDAMRSSPLALVLARWYAGRTEGGEEVLLRLLRSEGWSRVREVALGALLDRDAARVPASMRAEALRAALADPAPELRLRAVEGIAAGAAGGDGAWLDRLRARRAIETDVRVRALIDQILSTSAGEAPKR